MARFARVVVPGCPHHVLQRGNRKADVFGDDSDRLVYLRLLRTACKSHRVDVWAYTLMDNHVHIIAVPEREVSLAQTVKETHGEYSSYFNTKYGLVGHAWQGRFKSVPMETKHCWNAVRYVERNPVRAGMVSRAEDYFWSSAASHCGLREDMLLSQDCPMVREVENWSEWLKIVDSDGSEDIIRRHTRTGRPLGSAAFLVGIEERLGRRLLPKKRGPRVRKSTQSRTGGDDQSEPPTSNPLF